jgi:hypothetical protein
VRELWKPGVFFAALVALAAAIISAIGEDRVDIPAWTAVVVATLVVAIVAGMIFDRQRLDERDRDEVADLRRQLDERTRERDAVQGQLDERPGPRARGLLDQIESYARHLDGVVRDPQRGERLATAAEIERAHTLVRYAIPYLGTGGPTSARHLQEEDQPLITDVLGVLDELATMVRARDGALRDGGQPS